MTRELLSQAIREAYASAPTDLVILHTLEIRHPSFLDDQGNATALRLVSDRKDLVATLEAGAPVNAGQQVTFLSFPFEVSMPSIDDRSSPYAIIRIDNISRDMVKHIEAAVETFNVINITYRPYLSNDLSGPQFDPPMHLTLTNIQATIHSIQGEARFPELANKQFPGLIYEPSKFRGLTR